MKRISPRARRRWVVLAAVALALAIAAVVHAANYTTYYCGDALNWCTVYSDSPRSTYSVALRDDNIIECRYGCHTRVYYYSSSTGSFGVLHTNGGNSAYYLLGSQGYYVYSRCITDTGYGYNTAHCWTHWHD